MVKIYDKIIIDIKVIKRFLSVNSVVVFGCRGKPSDAESHSSDHL